MNHHNIIIFDGVCNLCNGFIKLIIKFDKSEKYKFTFLQSEFTDKIFDQFKINKDDFDSVLLIKGDNYYIKSEAVKLIADELGGIFKIFTLIKILPKKFSDFIYDWIAGNRYSLFGKKKQCEIPDPKYKDRFLI